MFVHFIHSYSGSVLSWSGLWMMWRVSWVHWVWSGNTLCMGSRSIVLHHTQHIQIHTHTDFRETCSFRMTMGFFLVCFTCRVCFYTHTWFGSQDSGFFGCFSPTWFMSFFKDSFTLVISPPPPHPPPLTHTHTWFISPSDFSHDSFFRFFRTITFTCDHILLSQSHADTGSATLPAVPPCLTFISLCVR